MKCKSVLLYFCSPLIGAHISKALFSPHEEGVVVIAMEVVNVMGDCSEEALLLNLLLVG